MWLVKRCGKIFEASTVCGEGGSWGELDNTYRITYVWNMKVITASKARANLYRLLDEAADSHEPIEITGKRSNAILIPERDWRAIQETLYLLSIPGMRASIRRGLKTPIEKCSEKLDW
jgi:prevent-host-death family protein